MAERKKKKKSEVINITFTILAVVVVVVVVGLVAGFIWREKYNEDYFVSDDSKLVISLDKDIASFEDGDYEPELTRIVYYYDGDTINSMKVFFDYEDEAEAKVANENITMYGKDWATSKNLNGKFIVFEVTKDQYEGLKTEDVRGMINDMKSAGTLYEDEEEIEAEEIDCGDEVDCDDSSTVAE